MKSWMLAVWITSTVLSLGVRTVRADPVVFPQWSHHVIRVDDDHEGGYRRGGDDWGDREGDGGGDGWVPWWLGFRMLAPQRQVIVEPPTYYAPPPPVENYAPPPQTYWYFCQNPEGYYPQIHQCPGGWLRVVPGGSPPP